MSLKTFKVRVLTWSDVVSHVWALADKILTSRWRPNVIIGIARGGMVPAMLLSDVLNVHDVLTMQLRHWPEPGKMMEHVEVKFDLPSVDLRDRDVLIVDDIVDTGDTLRFARDHVSSKHRALSVRTAALHLRRSRARYAPDFYGVEILGDEWIMYPWNYVEDLSSLILRALRDANANSISITQILDLLLQMAGREILSLDCNYLIQAIARLEELGYVERAKIDGVEIIRLKA